MSASRVLSAPVSTKWARLAELEPLEGEDSGWLHCPLCQEVLFGSICTGCPIREVTGKAGCCDTPYSEADKALLHYRNLLCLIDTSSNRLKTSARKAAWRELEFLVSLLPEGHQ